MSRPRAFRWTSILALMGALGSGSAADERPVIDVHLHAASDADLAGYGPHPQGLESASSAEALARDTIAALRRNHVVLGIVSAEAAGMDRLHALAPERIQRWPSVVVATGADGDADVRPPAAEVRERLEAGAWSGIGEVETVYRGLQPSAAALEPFYRLAIERDVPIALHSGISFPGIAWRDKPFFARTGSPLAWEEPLKRHPGLRISLMHAGYPFLDDTIAVLSVYPNVHVDTGAISHLFSRAEVHRYLGTLVTAGFGDRILFGSDQMVWPDAIDRAIEAIRSGPWDEAQTRAILYDNAARFLRLPSEVVERHHGR